MKKGLSNFISLASLVALLAVLSWIIYGVWGQFKLLDPTVSVGTYIE